MIMRSSPLVEAIHEQSLKLSGLTDVLRQRRDNPDDLPPEGLGCILMVMDGSARDEALIDRCEQVQALTAARIICLYEHDLPHVLRSTPRLKIFIFLKTTAPTEVIASAVVLARYLDALSGEPTPAEAEAVEDPDGPQAILTARQRDVLRLLAKGYSNKAMAQHLELSEPTVKMHLAALRRVLNASNRTETLVKAVKLGLHSF